MPRYKQKQEPTDKLFTRTMTGFCIIGICALGWVLLDHIAEDWTPDPAMTTGEYSASVRGGGE